MTLFNTAGLERFLIEALPDASFDALTAPLSLGGITELVSVTAVNASTPLPAALPLFATGLGALRLFGWRRKKKKAAA